MTKPRRRNTASKRIENRVASVSNTNDASAAAPIDPHETPLPSSDDRIAAKMRVVGRIDEICLTPFGIALAGKNTPENAINM